MKLNIFACNGILFNHESPLRGETFVTRKITRAVAKISSGLKDKFFRNLDARNWGHAKDYVRMMWMILQAKKPDDWVISTGRTTSVREFLIMCFNYVGIELEFKGKGINEKVYIKKCSMKEYTLDNGKLILEIDPTYYRPTEVDLLIGDSSKAKKELGWQPEISIEKLVSEMMENDLREVKKIKYLSQGGYDYY